MMKPSTQPMSYRQAIGRQKRIEIFIDLEHVSAAMLAKMAPERRARILKMVAEHRAYHADMRALNRRLAECTEKLENRWGFGIRPGMGKAVTDELDLAREALAAQRGGR